MEPPLTNSLPVVRDDRDYVCPSRITSKDEIQQSQNLCDHICHEHKHERTKDDLKPCLVYAKKSSDWIEEVKTCTHFVQSLLQAATLRTDLPKAAIAGCEKPETPPEERSQGNAPIADAVVQWR
jgi:hypothetical protein